MTTATFFPYLETVRGPAIVPCKEQQEHILEAIKKNDAETFRKLTSAAFDNKGKINDFAPNFTFCEKIGFSSEETMLTVAIDWHADKILEPLFKLPGLKVPWHLEKSEPSLFTRALYCHEPGDWDPEDSRPMPWICLPTTSPGWKARVYSVFRQLFQHPEISATDTTQGLLSTDLMARTLRGQLVPILRYWVASGKPYPDLATDRFQKYLPRTSRKFKNLVDDMITRQEDLRIEMQLKLGWPTPKNHAADIFAAAVFLCDGYLAHKTPDPAYSETPDAARFWRFMEGFPLELQMALANLAAGSPGASVTLAYSEAAFVRLAKHLSCLPNSCQT